MSTPPSDTYLQRIWKSLSKWTGFSSASPSSSSSLTTTILLVGVGVGVGVGIGVGMGMGPAGSELLKPCALSLSWCRVFPNRLGFSGFGAGAGSGAGDSGGAGGAYVRAILDKLAVIRSVALMGLASTAISGLVLCAVVSPYYLTNSVRYIKRRYRRQDSSDGVTDASASASASASPSPSSASSSDFESLFYDEYDTMMAMAAASATDAAGSAGSAGSTDSTDSAAGALTSLSAVPVTTPRCELVITYVPARSAFGYYTDRKDAIPYTHLETAARIFLVKNARPDLAKLAYVDRRKPSASIASASIASASIAPASIAPASIAPASIVPSTGGIFAMFKSYNRKQQTSAAAASSSSGTGSGAGSTAGSGAGAGSTAAVDTHFVYMGTMQDYKNTRNTPEMRSSSGSSSEETSYVNIKYADFKKNGKKV